MEVMVLNNTVLTWLTALGIAVGVAVALHLV